MHTSNYSLHYTFSVLTSHPLQNVLFYFSIVCPVDSNSEEARERELSSGRASLLPQSPRNGQ